MGLYDDCFNDVFVVVVVVVVILVVEVGTKPSTLVTAAIANRIQWLPNFMM